MDYLKITQIALDRLIMQSKSIWSKKNHIIVFLNIGQITLTFFSIKKIIVKEKLLSPTALTLDTIKKRLFWLDRKYDHIETCDYFGTRRFIIAHGSRNLPHAISLDLFESTLFYTDQTKLGVMKLTRHTITSAANITYHYKSTSSGDSNQKLPRSVRVYHQNKQLLMTRDNPCATNNGACKHTCLLSHAGAGDEAHKCHRCKCRVGYQLRRDLKTCERVAETLYVSQTSLIRSVSMETVGGAADSEQRAPILMPKTGAAVRSMDIDCKNNVTIYFDPIRRAIFANKLSASDQPDSEGLTRVLIPDNLVYVESIAFDWICKF